MAYQFQYPQSIKLMKRCIEIDIIDSIPQFNTPAYADLYMNRNCGNKAATKLRKVLRKTIMTMHDTEHGRYYILAYMRTHNIDHKLFSCDTHGGEKAARDKCMLYQKKMIKKIAYELLHEYDD